jgi:glyceraldehyde 3-phosphate dehydrogenase
MKPEEEKTIQAFLFRMPSLNIPTKNPYKFYLTKYFRLCFALNTNNKHMARIAINGLGRIGRATFKLLIENQDLELVAINDLASPAQLSYLLNFDSVYGKLLNKVSYDDSHLYINNKQIKVLNIKEPSLLPWNAMRIDIVFECTGRFTRKEDLEKHIQAGAQYVILSAPSKSDDVPTIVPGVNRPEDQSMKIISCASCTTNCITPVVEIMGRRIGIKKAIMTTLHAYTSSQSLLDNVNKDLRRGRSAAENFIPTSTGAARTTTKVLPQYLHKFDGVAIRGPIPVGSIADITFITERSTSVEEVNNIFREEAGSERYLGIVGVNTEPIVSSDIIMDPRASIIDFTMTQVVDEDLVKIMSWYDNEWGYVNQMVRAAQRIARLESALYV